MSRRAPARVTSLSVAAAMACALVFCARADAQITVTNATFPAAGDTLQLAHDNAPGPCVFITPPDFSAQTWDFSCLETDATQDIVYRPASEGSVVVPGAELFAVTTPYLPNNAAPPSPLVEEYYDVTSTGFRVQATYGKHYYVVPNSLFRTNPPLEVRSAPLNFFDIRQTSSGILEPFDDTQMDPAVLQRLPFTADSFRYREAVSELAVVDAHGSLSIPGGTYDVLREKRTRYHEKRIDAKINPLGWLDVTDVFIQFIGSPFLGIDTVVHYSFYSNVAKEPIAVVATDNTQLRPVKVTYKNVQPVCQNDGDCDDNDPCTIDSCNPVTGCVHEPNPVCATPIEVLASALQAESCAPANGALDPDERVTYAVTLRNNGTQSTTKLVATLLASSGVSAPSGSQNYGVIPPGGSATRSFSWTGVGTCGATWSAALALADNGQAVPGVTVAGVYGTPGGVCNIGCAVVRIATKTTLKRNTDGSVQATVKVSNTGSVQANNVVLTSALLGTSSGSPLPQAAANILPGQSKTLTVTFPSSVLAGASVLRLGGTYTGATFSSSVRVTVP